MSWLDAVHTGHSPAGSLASVSADHVGQVLGRERGEDEREVERELQLVALAVERGQRAEIADPGFAEQQPRGRVAVRDLPPVPVDPCDSGRFALYTWAQPEPAADQFAA